MAYVFTNNNYGKDAYVLNMVFFILCILTGSVLIVLGEQKIGAIIISCSVLITYRLLLSGYVKILDGYIQIHTAFKTLKIPLTKDLRIEYIDKSGFLGLTNLKNSTYGYSIFRFTDTSNNHKISLYFPTYLRLRNSEIVFKALKGLYYEYSAQKSKVHANP